MLGFVEEGNLPDIMSFANGIFNEEENLIIYYTLILSLINTKAKLIKIVIILK